MTDLEGQDKVITTIREYVDAWRGFGLQPASQPYPDSLPRYEPNTDAERPLTDVSKMLLNHWFRPEPHELANGTAFKYWPHQRRAAETFIYLYEVLGLRRSEQLYELADVESLGSQVDPWAKLGAQLATGSGKTKVMSLLVAWSTLNAALDPRNTIGLGRHSLVIAPGLFVRDRLLADFRPSNGPSVFFRDPIIPPELASEWDLTVYDSQSCPRRLDPSRGALVVTNYHPLLREPEELPRAFGSKAQLGIDLLFGGKNPSMLEDSSTTLLERFEGSRGVLVINDEAHHVGDEQAHTEFERKRREKNRLGSDEEEAMAWIRCLRKLHGTKATSRLALQIDLSATLFNEKGIRSSAGKKDAKSSAALRPVELFRHTVLRYDLRSAIRDGIVKHPILERISITNTETGDPEELVRDGAPNAWEKYRNLVVTGVRRWLKVREQLREEGDQRKPILFLLCENQKDAHEITNFLRHGDVGIDEGEVIGFPDPEGGQTLFVEDSEHGGRRSTIVEVHIGQKESRNEADWAKIREVVNTIDTDEFITADGERHRNPYNVVVSVMMLKEGWDVRNVKVIVPLRPCDSRTLTEQILGRGLRKMHAPTIHEDGSATMDSEALYVMEHPSFAKILAQIEDILEVRVSSDISHNAGYVGIVPKDDAALRALRSVRLLNFDRITRTRENWLADFQAKQMLPLTPRLAWLPRIPETEIKTFLVEMMRQRMNDGLDFRISDTYSYHTLDQVIENAYVKPILDEMKVAHVHKTTIKGIVRTYLERSTFALPPGLPVRFDNLDDAESAGLILGNLARNEVMVAVRDALVRVLTAMRGGNRLIERSSLIERHTKDLDGYQALRKNVIDPAHKTTFVRTATDNPDEARLAVLLDQASDVEGWVYNHRQGVQFIIEYDYQGRPRHYYPDFIARARIGAVIHNLIIEVKGRIDDTDRSKCMRGQWYAETLTRHDSEPWHFVLLIENRSEGRLDLTAWAKQPIPSVGALLRHHEALPLFPDREGDEMRVAYDPPDGDRFRRAVPIIDLDARGGPLGSSRVAESERWAYLPLGQRVDDQTFVAQVSGVSMEPMVPSGSWCLFRAYPDDATASIALDRRRVLVEVGDDTGPDDEGCYALKRVVVTKRGSTGEIQEIELRSDNQRIGPIVVSADGLSRFAIRAELLRTLKSS